MSCSERSTAGVAPLVFDLPADLIAQEPTGARDGSRLLVVRRGLGVVGEGLFRDLPAYLRAGDLLVVNDSRVLPARLWARRETGGRVELLLVRPAATGDWLALVRPARRIRADERLQIESAEVPAPRNGAGSSGISGGSNRRGSERFAPPCVEVVTPPRDGWITLRCRQRALVEVAERWGEAPLPPYIRRDPGDPDAPTRRARDRRRYQTVYARGDDRAGSVAAPTAGLHFTAALLARLREAGIDCTPVTLHVGPGTFLAPTPAQVRARRLHRESFTLPAATEAALRRTRAAGGRVVAVGTTTLRVLETVRRLALPAAPETGSCLLTFGDEGRSDGVERPLFRGSARGEAGSWTVCGDTRLFVQPGDEVEVADAMITNFHLPGSSLLMLVAAMMGGEIWREVYAHAVRRRFRFYSYGDAMLILPAAAGSVPAGPGRRSRRVGDDDRV